MKFPPGEKIGHSVIILRANEQIKSQFDKCSKQQKKVPRVEIHEGDAVFLRVLQLSHHRDHLLIVALIMPGLLKCLDSVRPILAYSSALQLTRYILSLCLIIHQMHSLKH